MYECSMTTIVLHTCVDRTVCSTTHCHIPSIDRSADPICNTSIYHTAPSCFGSTTRATNITQILPYVAAAAAGAAAPGAAGTATAGIAPPDSGCCLKTSGFLIMAPAGSTGPPTGAPMPILRPMPAPDAPRLCPCALLSRAPMPDDNRLRALIPGGAAVALPTVLR